MTELSYAAFGEALVYCAVTPERIANAVNRIAGDSVELGPLRAGPGGAATVRAVGRIGEPVADEVTAPGGCLTYLVEIPVEVSLEVKVGAVGRYEATGRVALQLSVRAVEPLCLRIDVEPVAADSISFDIAAKGMQARLLQRAGDVEGELKAHTARFVNSRIEAPEARRYTHIDLMPVIESVWDHLHS